ncbi:Flp pilus assembly protein CpaB [Nocardiopsis mwathae]|uniref:Flp pilus assembly protein CpaB n=1 Tax=Nocardiopsis mwathae TaxID=1472723 RepID=A0A7W9YJY7_9ACTN|nr:SAF domain-containing protein [Nocardiopsis mwathae]MBB6173548.1 Flp pilus assembly protein CpaB [Nocardiopsis mwathae]
MITGTPRAFVHLARYRRPLGAVCAALALGGAVLIIRPPPAPTVEVLVAARDLTAESPLTAADLTARALPSRAVPDGALRPDSAPVGSGLAGPMRRGEVLTTARVADPPASGYGADLVAAPVRVADPGAVALLHPGSRVDILSAAPAPAADLGAAAPAAATVAANRPVIAVPDEQGAISGEAGALILVAVSDDEARALAGRAAAERLSITIRG